jgi:beta-galactosidase
METFKMNRNNQIHFITANSMMMILKTLLIPGIVVSAFLFIGCSGQHAGNFSTDNKGRQETLFDFDWKFYRGDAGEAWTSGFDDSGWRELDLPHDWSIENIPGTESPVDSSAVGGINTGYYVGGTGWYRKKFDIPKNNSGKIFTVMFEGVYMNTDVWFNEVHLGNHPYGYTSFELDLTDHIKPGGENVLAVRVRNEGRNSRWYSGSGIYRHVWLTVTEPIHLKTWGTFITTPVVTKESAEVNLAVVIENRNGETHNIKVSTRIYHENGEEVASDINELTLPKGENNTQFSLRIDSPELWSPDEPALYRAVVEVQDSDGKMIDQQTTNFGIRTLNFSVENGFLLNGRQVLLKGACMHHDNGPLGAAAYDRAEERRVELMKANGYNAIRCAHNPPSVAFLDACDRLGMLVIDEAFDMWRKPKNPQDYHLYFDEYWKKDIEAMVLRDRNHPSIIMWSTGNEIPERGEPEGAETSKMLAGYVKQLDPTRPVTAAVNGLNPDKDPYFATLDISGYNYSFGGDHGKKTIFETDHERVPGRIMYCAESYPLEAFGAWQDVVNHSYVLGDFVWTGFDYLGEASIGWRGYPHDENFYPWNQAYCGDIDICGLKRPQSYYRDVLWGVGTQLSVFVKPPVPSFPEKENRASWSKWHWHDHIASWNWDDYKNHPLEVVVYSAHDEVELYLNGKSLGKRETNLRNQFMATWNVPFQPGELKAVAMSGESVKAEHVLQTAGKPAKMKLSADRDSISATGQDLSYIMIELLDEMGTGHPGAENLLHFEIDGPAKIIAVASSDPASTESFTGQKRKAWKGKALVIVKSTKETGTINLSVSSEGIEPASVSIEVI